MQTCLTSATSVGVLTAGWAHDQTKTSEVELELEMFSAQTRTVRSRIS